MKSIRNYYGFIGLTHSAASQEDNAAYPKTSLKIYRDKSRTQDGGQQFQLTSADRPVFSVATKNNKTDRFFEFLKIVGQELSPADHDLVSHVIQNTYHKEELFWSVKQNPKIGTLLLKSKAIYLYLQPSAFYELFLMTLHCQVDTYRGAWLEKFKPLIVEASADMQQHFLYACRRQLDIAQPLIKKYKQKFFTGSFDLIVLYNFTKLLPELLPYFVSTAMGYDLCLMSELPESNPEKAEEYKLYLSDNGDYIVRDPDGKVKQDSLRNGGIDLRDLPYRLKDQTLKKAILELTSTRGHTPATQATYEELLFILMVQDEQIRRAVIDHTKKVKGNFNIQNIWATLLEIMDWQDTSPIAVNKERSSGISTKILQNFIQLGADKVLTCIRIGLLSGAYYEVFLKIYGATGLQVATLQDKLIMLQILSRAGQFFYEGNNTTPLSQEERQRLFNILVDSLLTEVDTYLSTYPLRLAQHGALDIFLITEIIASLCRIKLDIAKYQELFNYLVDKPKDSNSLLEHMLDAVNQQGASDRFYFDVETIVAFFRLRLDISEIKNKPLMGLAAVLLEPGYRVDEFTDIGISHRYRMCSALDSGHLDDILEKLGQFFSCQPKLPLFLLKERVRYTVFSIDFTQCKKASIMRHNAVALCRKLYGYLEQLGADVSWTDCLLHAGITIAEMNTFVLSTSLLIEEKVIKELDLNGVLSGLCMFMPSLDPLVDAFHVSIYTPEKIVIELSKFYFQSASCLLNSKQKQIFSNNLQQMFACSLFVAYLAEYQAMLQEINQLVSINISCIEEKKITQLCNKINHSPCAQDLLVFFPHNLVLKNPSLVWKIADILLQVSTIEKIRAAAQKLKDRVAKMKSCQPHFYFLSDAITYINKHKIDLEPKKIKAFSEHLQTEIMPLLEQHQLLQKWHVAEVKKKLGKSFARILRKDMSFDSVLASLIALEAENSSPKKTTQKAQTILARVSFARTAVSQQDVVNFCTLYSAYSPDVRQWLIRAALQGIVPAENLLIKRLEAGHPMFWHLLLSDSPGLKNILAKIKLPVLLQHIPVSNSDRAVQQELFKLCQQEQFAIAKYHAQHLVKIKKLFNLNENTGYFSWLFQSEHLKQPSQELLNYLSFVEDKLFMPLLGEIERLQQLKSKLSNSDADNAQNLLNIKMVQLTTSVAELAEQLRSDVGNRSPSTTDADFIQHLNQNLLLKTTELVNMESIGQHRNIIKRILMILIRAVKSFIGYLFCASNKDKEVSAVKLNSEVIPTKTLATVKQALVDLQTYPLAPKAQLPSVDLFR